MPTKLLIAQNTGSKVYSVGRVGLDSGLLDAGGVYTGLFVSERMSPAGEGGLVLFRRVMVRIWHSGSFTAKLRVFVDEVQTKYYSSGALIDQEGSFTQAAPTISPDETMIELDLNAVGTFLQVELEVDSNNITGIFLPESAQVGGRIVRQGRQRTGELI